MNLLWIMIVGGFLIYGIHWLVHWVMRKRSAKMITNEELQEVIRKVQIIDVREHPEYKAKHILGARSIPSAEFKHRVFELRKDIPVCLYDDESLTKASRCANTLRKEGFEDVYILENGFAHWDGRTKTLL